MEKKRPKAVNIILTVLLSIPIMLAMMYLTEHFSNQLRFFPTIEEAFANHSDGRRDFGETLFVDNHGDNLTIVHKRNTHFFVSHYIREVREGEVWYACIWVSTGGAMFFPGTGDPDSRTGQLAVQFYLNERALGQRLWEPLGRRPLHGFSFDRDTAYMRINGYLVEHVILLEESRYLHSFGEFPFYFWYFSDFPFVFNSPDDIVISFGD